MPTLSCGRTRCPGAAREAHRHKLQLASHDGDGRGFCARLRVLLVVGCKSVRPRNLPGLGREHRRLSRSRATRSRLRSGRRARCSPRRRSPGIGPTVAEYWLTGSAPNCRDVRPTVVAGKRRMIVDLTRIRPASRYHVRLAARSGSGTVFGAARAFVTLPVGRVPEGVTAGRTYLGRMRRSAALRLLQQSAGAPLTFSYEGARWRVSPVHRRGPNECGAAGRRGAAGRAGRDAPGAQIELGRREAPRLRRGPQSPLGSQSNAGKRPPGRDARGHHRRHARGQGQHRADDLAREGERAVREAPGLAAGGRCGKPLPRPESGRPSWFASAIRA